MIDVNGRSPEARDRLSSLEEGMFQDDTLLQAHRDREEARLREDADWDSTLQEALRRGEPSARGEADDPPTEEAPPEEPDTEAAPPAGEVPAADGEDSAPCPGDHSSVLEELQAQGKALTDLRTRLEAAERRANRCELMALITMVAAVIAALTALAVAVR